MATKMTTNEIPSDEWSRWSETCQRLRNLSGPQFETLCYSLLLKRGRRLSEDYRLIPGGLTYTRAVTPRPGPVDAALVTSSGPTVLAGFGVIPPKDKRSWLEKLDSDFNKIREVARRQGLTNVHFLFMTTADLQPEQVLAAEQRFADDHIITKVDINPLMTIAQDLTLTAVDLADRFLGIPIPLQRFVRLDFGTASSRRDLPLPRRSDFENSVVYLHESYRTAIQERLTANRRCVLWGGPSSGKTWLAAAYCVWAENYVGTPTYYVDATTIYRGEGRSWYREAVLGDATSPIFIIDNCQAAPQEVDEFCRQFDSAPKELISRSSVILIVTRTDIPKRSFRMEPTEEWHHRYGVPVHSEELWVPMVRAYGQFLRAQDGEKFAEIEEDLQQNREIMESRHAYDLAASRARLETWKENGGKLSEVADDAFYGYVERRYVSPAPELIRMVCALWSYEIPTHQRFLEGETNIRADVERLLSDGLLIEDVASKPLYGRCLRPVLHRNMAAEVFKTWVRRDNPLVATSPEGLSNRMTSTIREYLLRKPLNAASVYRALHQLGEDQRIATLLGDPEMVQAGESILQECPGPDVAVFLTCLHLSAPGRVSEILDGFRNEQAQAFLADRLQQVPAAVMLSSLNIFRKLDDSFAKELVSRLDPVALGKQLSMASLQSVRTLLNVLSREDYPTDSLDTVVSYLDPIALGSREYEGGFQSVCWLARSLDRHSLVRGHRGESAGQAFLRKLGGQQLAAIWRKRATPEVLKLFFQISSRDIRESMVRELSDDELSSMLRDMDLKDFANLMHWYPLISRGYEKLKRSGGMRARLMEASAAEIGLCLHICRQKHNSPKLARELLGEVVAAGEYGRFLEREDLLALALLLNHARQIDRDSAKKLAAVLEDAARTRMSLSRSSLNGIQLLIYNLAQLRDVKEKPTHLERCFAREVAGVDLSQAIAAATLPVLDHFVWNMYEFVDRDLARAFCSPLLNRLMRDVKTLSLEDVGRATWTLAKVWENDAALVSQLLGMLKDKAELEDPAGLPNILILVGCMESIALGTTADWNLPNVDERSIGELVLTQISGLAPKPVVVALMLINRG